MLAWDHRFPPSSASPGQTDDGGQVRLRATSGHVKVEISLTRHDAQGKRDPERARL